MTIEQDALLQKARRSLQAAQILTDQGFHEFSVSRAYYAMFYAAEALLLAENLSYSKHSAVIAALGRRFVKTGRIPPERHRYLIEAQSSRNVGDYDIGLGLSQTDAEKHTARAQEFIAFATNFIAPS